MKIMIGFTQRKGRRKLSKKGWAPGWALGAIVNFLGATLALGATFKSGEFEVG